ncbi:MAG: GNAT family N-acetyltransferase [Planctomycetota bacterium]|nr:GNAT family N-acetyltransferase [Planctomycetota bacterium]MDA1105519.1 GNAT family N-acetyltransferase [Planctomycetota bacterium]
MPSDSVSISIMIPDSRLELETLGRTLFPAEVSSRKRLLGVLASRHLEHRYAALATLRGSSSRAAAAVLDRPGGAGSLLLSPLDNDAKVGLALLGAAGKAACARFLHSVPHGVVLSLSAMGDARQAAALSASGLVAFTSLVFLVADLSEVSPLLASPVAAAQPDAEVAPLPNDFTLLERTLEATYADAMDCPELTLRRTAHHVLQGHLNQARSIPPEWLGAWVDGRLAGIVLCRPRERSPDDSESWDVIYVGVCAWARRRGVACLLLRSAATLLYARGAHHMALACDVRNRPARNLYERLGFRLVDERHAWLDRQPSTVLHNL